MKNLHSEIHPTSEDATTRTIVIREFVDELVDETELSREQGRSLWESYRKYIDLDFPSPKTDYKWRLTSQGWVGVIPLDRDLVVRLEPKVPIGNLFRMLEYAYNLKSFVVLEGLVEAASLQDVYDRLAIILADRVLLRARQGLYRSYVAEDDRLPYVRGSMDVGSLMRKPWDVSVHCHYQEHTGDVEENQILAWTLYTIARGGSCSPRAIARVRAAYRALHGSTTLRHFAPRQCIGRLYNRLNDDYQPLHALCRFFLEHTGPSHEAGDRKMLPFLVNMGRLYELFVAEWLKRNLPAPYRLEAQEKVSLDEHNRLGINIDLVIYDRETGEPIWVLDTKYKAPDAPSPKDLNQIIAYAAAKRCPRGVLIYPVELAHAFSGRYAGSDFFLQTLRFGLEQDLQAEGEAFLRELSDGE